MWGERLSKTTGKGDELSVTWNLSVNISIVHVSLFSDCLDFLQVGEEI